MTAPPLRRAAKTRIGALLSCVGLATALTIAVAPSAGATISGDVSPDTETTSENGAPDAEATPGDMALLTDCSITLQINTDNQIKAAKGTCSQVKVKHERYQSDVGYIDFIGGWGAVSDSGSHSAGNFVFNAEMHELPAGTFSLWKYVR